MIGTFLETCLTTRKLFEMPFGRSGPAFLEALTQSGMAFAVLLNQIPAEGFPFRVCRQIDYAQIDSEASAFWLIGVRRGNLKCYRKKERSVVIDQVRLPLNRTHTRRLIATHAEGNKEGSFLPRLKDRCILSRV